MRFTLRTTLRRKPSSGDYQKKTRLMSTTTAKTESQTCDAEPTTAMNSASTMDKTAAPASRIFQPFGSGTDDNSSAYTLSNMKQKMLALSIL